MIRKIITKEDHERKRKKNQIIISIILVGIMVFSTIAYSFGTNTSQKEITIKYKNYDFTYSNGLWETNISGNVFSFIYNPFEIYNVTSNVNSLENYQNKPLYIYSINSDAEQEIYQNLYTISGNITYACPEDEKNCDETLAVKDCSNNFIIIREGNSSNIYQKDKCAFISGPFENLTEITDGFLLKVIGVQ
jgi:hypothetical protein